MVVPGKQTGSGYDWSKGACLEKWKNSSSSILYLRLLVGKGFFILLKRSSHPLSHS